MKGYGKAVRRGIALGLALVALWGVGLTADPAALRAGLARPEAALALLSSQLRFPAAEEPRALTGWGRLLLGQSPLLAAGEEGVARLREERGKADSDPLRGDGDDQEEPNLSQSGEDGVVEMTAQGKEEGKYLYGQGVYLYNRTDLELDASVLEEGEVSLTAGEGPQILILHTHGSEAYSQSDGNTYEESDPYRTTDCTRNVVRVGEVMATVLRAHGLRVVHDTTLYDYPAYNGAYDRSGAAVEEWLTRYPSIQVVLDVHRDALVSSDGQVYKLVSTEAGEKVAQVMLVVGSSGSGEEHPRWRDNLALGVALQQELTRGYASLARPIVLRSSRYNQQLLPGSLLVEVGGHGNTLTEAIAGARLWTDNVARTLLRLGLGEG